MQNIQLGPEGFAKRQQCFFTIYFTIYVSYHNSLCVRYEAVRICILLLITIIIINFVVICIQS